MSHNLLNYSLHVGHQLLSSISPPSSLLFFATPAHKSLNHGESIQPPASSVPISQLLRSAEEITSWEFVPPQIY